MKIATANRGNYNAIRNLWDSCFFEDSIEWRDWYFENKYNSDNVNVLLKDNKLVSMVHMNPYTLMLNNNYIKSAAMAGVATHISHRKNNYAKRLIEYSLHKAYKDGYEYSFLRPFNYDFYEKFGYRSAYNIYSYKVSYDNNASADGIEVLSYSESDDNTLRTIYYKAMQKFNGYVARDTHYFHEYINGFAVDSCQIKIFHIGKNIGYYIYDTVNKRVEELFFTGNLTDAYTSLCRYIGHDITIKNQPFVDISNTSIARDEKKHCMVRVINFESVISKFKFQNSTIIIRIKDDIIHENNNTFRITAKDGTTSITTTDEEERIALSINEVSAILAYHKGEGKKLNEFFSAKSISKSSFLIEDC